MKVLTKGINPENKNQARVFLNIQDYQEFGFKGHPHEVILKLIPFGSKVIGAVPQSMFDGWDFWLELDGNYNAHDLIDDYVWKPVNQA